jgi:hypothetical protein
MEEEVIRWLLEPEEPSIRYRTMVELLDYPSDDARAQEARSQIPRSEPVRAIIEKMHPGGYWLQRNPRTGEVVGDGVKYGSFGTTHYCLSYLAELGMDRGDERIARAADRYLGLQREDGDFLSHYSCLIGYNIRTFIMLGYRDDERVQRSIDLLLGTERADGGYLCDTHEGKYRTRPVKSCVRGSLKALLAFSRLPEYWGHERVRRLVGYFLGREGIYRTSNPNELVNKDMTRNSFPVTWRANVFEVLLSLSRMGLGGDERLRRAWRAMDSKRDTQGRYPLDWSPRQSPWKVGEREEPNKWVTFYSYLAHKHRGNTPPVPAE